MASILTLRLPPAKLARVDRRAAELGRDRSAYVRALIDQDLERPAANRRHKFASEDLIGAFDTGQGTADNTTVAVWSASACGNAVKNIAKRRRTR